jgi:predicted nucleic acid-binding protein
VNGVVIDASVALDWFLTEGDSCPAWDKLGVLDQYVPVVPEIWRLEVTNALVSHVRYRSLPIDIARTILGELNALPVAVLDDVTPAGVMELAISSGLTTYDASYLDVAMRGGWPLVTVDADLVRAARDVGVTVV